MRLSSSCFTCFFDGTHENKFKVEFNSEMTGNTFIDKLKDKMKESGFFINEDNILLLDRSGKNLA